MGKDKEGGEYVEYGAAVSFPGIAWPASGKVQAMQYGQRLPYIYNMNVIGEYECRFDTEKGNTVYHFSETNMELSELDGICLFCGKEEGPDYKIISIKPYRPLMLEVEKI